MNSVQSLSCVQLFETPWTVARQASLSITNSQSLLKLMSVKSVMPSNHLILCCPLLLLPSIIPRIRVFSSESVLRNRWPKYCSFSFSISPSNECHHLWGGLSHSTSIFGLFQWEPLSGHRASFQYLLHCSSWTLLHISFNSIYEIRLISSPNRSRCFNNNIKYSLSLAYWAPLAKGIQAQRLY